MGRVEILAGRERRRHWSDDQKRVILEEASASGLSLAAVARRHDIVPQQIYTWRRELRASSPTFLPVVVAPPEEMATREGAVGGNGKERPTRGVERIEVRCRNGRVLKVAAGLDAEVLKALIRAVEAA